MEDDVILHGQLSWNNTWPRPRPNTNMCDWVWVMEVCFDMMVSHHERTHGPSQDPIPICVNEYGWWRYALIWWYMVGHHETTYGPSQDPIPICMIEYGWWRYALIWWYMVGHHEITYGPSQGPIPICVIEYGLWRFALIWWYMVGHHETQAKTQYQNAWSSIDDRGI